MKKWIVWALLLALCIAPVLGSARGETLAPGALLPARLQIAQDAGQAILFALKAELGEGAMLMMSQEVYEAVQSALDVIEIQCAYAANAAEPFVDFAILVSGAPVLTGTAWAGEDALLLATSALPDKTLLFPYESLQALLVDSMEDGSMTAMVSGMTGQSINLVDGMNALSMLIPIYAGYLEQWADEEAIIATVEEAVAVTATRDASVMTVSVNMLPEQPQKLALALAEAHRDDAELQQALASLMGPSTTPKDIAQNADEVIRSMQEAKPLDNPISLTGYLDEDGQLVGMDIVVPQLYEDNGQQQAAIRYDRKTDGATQTNTVAGQVTSADGDAMDFSLIYSTENEDPSVLRNTLDLQIMDPSGNVAIAMIGENTTTAADGVETYSQSVWLDGDPQMMGGILPVITVESETNAYGDIDFMTDTAFSLGLSDGQGGVISLATLRWMLGSSDQAASTAQDGETVDLLSLPEEEQLALLEELQNGLMQAFAGALASLPPEAMTLLMSAEP